MSHKPRTFRSIVLGPVPPMQPILGTKRDVRLLDSIEYAWMNEDDRLEILIVPRGFCHDGPSIPDRLRGIIYYTHKMLRASIIHDYLYVMELESWERIEADQLFRQILYVEDLSSIGEFLMYRAVRLGGSWERNDHESSQHPKLRHIDRHDSRR